MSKLSSQRMIIGIDPKLVLTIRHEEHIVGDVIHLIWMVRIHSRAVLEPISVLIDVCILLVVQAD